MHRIVGGSDSAACQALGAEENGGSSNGMRILDLVLQRLDLSLKFLSFFFLMSTKTLSHLLLPANAQ